MEIEQVRIEQLKPAAYNPRVDLVPGDPTYESLKRGINEYGCVQPLVVNHRTGNVVGGHQRLMVMKDLGYAEVPVVYVDLPDDQEKALNLSLNKIDGEWNYTKLCTLFQELELTPNFDDLLTGFSTDEMGDIVSRVLDQQDNARQDDPLEPDFSHPAITQAGELLDLGAHRLLCGDSTDPDQVGRLMDGKRAPHFHTDPPYLVNYDGTDHPAAKGKNKSRSSSAGIKWDDAKANPDLYEKFYRVAVAEAITPNAAWYCWHASRNQGMVEGVWNKFGAFVHQQIIWVKDRPILGRSWYTWQHEPCFFGWVRPHMPRRVAQNHLPSVWSLPTVPIGQPTEHPTSKPVELFANTMRQHTRRGEICYEPFCGSGSQLIAAEQLDRRCNALEISPHYCDVIVRRWIRFVGPSNCPAELVQRYVHTHNQEAQS